MSQTRYSDDPEIRKVQEHAEQLGIYEIILNIVNEGDKSLDEEKQTEWEGCILRLNETIQNTQLKQGSAVASLVAQANQLKTTSITMPDGTLLYCSQTQGNDEPTVTDFRFGKWVERITTYTNEVTAQYQQKLKDKAEQKRAEKLKPFSEIDF